MKKLLYTSFVWSFFKNHGAESFIVSFHEMTEKPMSQAAVMFHIRPQWIMISAAFYRPREQLSIRRCYYSTSPLALTRSLSTPAETTCKDLSGSRAEPSQGDAAPITHPVFVKWYCLNYYLMRLVNGRDLLMKDSVAWQNLISVFPVPRRVPQVQRLPVENVVQRKKYKNIDQMLISGYFIV